MVEDLRDQHDEDQRNQNAHDGVAFRIEAELLALFLFIHHAHLTLLCASAGTF